MSSSSSSDDPHWEHDVFLSFRGTDTRNSFTSHLCDALTRSGIRTFIDDQQLPSGEDINPKLRQAIQHSRASIIVLSQNYASSTWCLEELVEILECKRSKGQMVFPIYYDVEPCVLRFLTGRYAEAFEKHGARVVDENVQKWRDALQEVAGLKGHVLTNEENGNEARFIHKIVGKLQVEVIARSSNVTESLVEANIDSNRNCINTLLSIESIVVRIIGIYGMGGIGKSTISKAVYNEHVNKFEGSAIVENIKEVSKQADGLLRLQERLLRQLEKNDVKLDITDQGINRIKKICESRRVLIVLDDFDNVSQINKLAGQNSWFSKGSRVIVVTRDVKLLKEAQVKHTYELKVLNEKESLQLFIKHAIEEQVTPSEDQISLSKDIARYCGGLPLALEVFGSHLRGENLTFWKNALKEYQSKPPKTVQDRLKISYDSLSKDRRSVFLDAACFFIGWDREYLIKFWSGCGFPENSVRDLSDKCLIKFDENDCLWMHDLFRDMGREIVIDALDESFEKHSRLWIHEKVLDVLRSEIKKAAVEGICFDSSKSQYTKLDVNEFEMMHKLRFLQINQFDVTGSFEQLFGELRWLSWRVCPMDILPFGFRPAKLVGLDMKYSRMNMLWEGVKHLEHLKFIDLSHCELLEETPDVTGTPSLERLVFFGCKKLSRIHPSICQLRSLLQLNLGGCISLQKIPEQIGNMEALQTLNLSRTWITELPDSIGCLHKLVHMHLEGCRRLKTLPTSICSLRSLQELNLSHCWSLLQLPDRSGSTRCSYLDNLKFLDLSHSKLMKETPDFAGTPSLVRLILTNCEKLTRIDPSVCELRALEELLLQGCSSLEHLPERLGSIGSLQTLNLSGTLITALPDSIGRLRKLLHLQLEYCVRLETLPISICNLRSLQELYLYGCANLRHLPDQLGDMEGLLELNLGHCCKNITDFPVSMSNLTSLTKLTVSFNSNLCRLPEKLGDMKCLVDLEISYLDNLTNLPASVCNLTALQKLNLEGCSRLEQLPEELGNLKGLLELDLRGCANLSSLPVSTCSMISLETLNVGWCSNLKELPEGLENLKKLSIVGKVT